MTIPSPQEVLAGKRCLFVLCGFDLGGAERQALLLARHLKGLGCDVRVWGHHHHHPGPEFVIPLCEAAGIPWAEYKFRWPCGKRALLRDAWCLLKGLYRERPDLIIPYLPWPSVGCGLVWRISPAKVCIWGQRDTDDLRGDAVERLAYRHCSAVICNARHEVEYLRHTLGEIKKPVHVVHNGFELAPCQKTRAQWRADLGISAEAAVVTMLANFRPQKDHPALLHAWHRLLAANPDLRPRSRLVLAGARQTSFPSVRELAATLDLVDSVSFLDQVTDVAGLLAASDIGVLATTHEGLPNAVLEYMASGLPVVATDIPGIREALGNDQEQQFCMPGDVQSIEERLRLLLVDPNLRRELGARNKLRASEQFSVEVMCRKTTEILAELLLARP